MSALSWVCGFISGFMSALLLGMVILWLRDDSDDDDMG
jgi:hypothetical protein